MRVVLDGGIYDQQRHGGITRLYNQLLPALCELEPELSLEVLHGRSPAQTPPSHPRIISIHCDARPLRLPLPRLTGALAASLDRHRRGRALTEIENRHRPAIWHAAYYSVPVGWRGPVVTLVYDMGSERFPEFFQSRRKQRFVMEKARAISRADRVLCISEATRDDVLRFTEVDGERLEVVYPACDPVFRRTSSAEGASCLPSQQPFLLFVGRRGDGKNFETLVEAYRIWQHRDEIALLLVGPPFTEPERRRLAAAGLEGRVILISKVEDTMLCSLYNHAAAMVYPSIYEGFGFPLLEAMTCGCPVVASRIPSSSEIGGELPVYFDPVDAGGLAAALDVVIAEGRNSARTLAGERWAKRYSWERAAQQTLAVYRALLKEALPA